MWLAWLLAGVILGIIVTAIIVVGAQGDILREVQRLRALEDDMHRLELRIIDQPHGVGDVLRVRLTDLRLMWKWASSDGRWILAEGLSVSPIVVLDEIGDPIK